MIQRRRVLFGAAAIVGCIRDPWDRSEFISCHEGIYPFAVASVLHLCRVCVANSSRGSSLSLNLLSREMSAVAKPTPGERYLRTADVCKQLSLHRNTVLRYVKRGAFGPVLRLEQDIRFPESAVAKFIEARLA